MAKPHFNNLRVLSLESRRAAEISALISNFGGRPTVAPALREIPLSSNTAALQFGQRLVQGEFDVVIFLTGVGARALLATIEQQQPRDAFLEALRRTKVVARGSKPVAVLREWQVPVWAVAPEPNTWHEVLATIDEHWSELPANPSVAVQEYGVSNPDLLDGLATRGANITRVPVYQWGLPEDTEPLKRATEALARGDFDVALFTTGVQVMHLFQFAETLGLALQVQHALGRIVIGSIGPTTSEELQRHDLQPDIVASHPKMGLLVTEAAGTAREMLSKKTRRPGS